MSKKTKQKYNQLNTEEECLVFKDYFSKCMEGLMDQHEWIRLMDDGCVILFVHLAGFFPVSSPLLDILLERILLGYFGAPSEEGNYITTPFFFSVWHS